MKRILSCLVAVFMLAGCKNDSTELEQGMMIRNRIIGGKGISFSALITADYFDRLYSFRMSCQQENNGELAFTVIEPETIGGIHGGISDDGCKLTFEEHVLLFEPMTESRLSPILGPWLMMKALRSGYIKRYGKDENGLYLQIDDIYKDIPLTFEIWVDQHNLPIRCDVMSDSCRILSIEVENFTIL